MDDSFENLGEEVILTLLFNSIQDYLLKSFFFFYLQSLQSIYTGNYDSTIDVYIAET